MRLPKITGYDGQYDHLYTNPGGGGLVEWSPGDATRYLLVVHPLRRDEAWCLGFAPGTDAVLVSVGTNGTDWTTIPMMRDSLVHEVYFAEKAQKTGLSDYCIRAYTALINMVIGSEKYGIDLANQLLQRGDQ